MDLRSIKPPHPLPAGGNRLVTAATTVPALHRFEGFRLKIDRLDDSRRTPVLVTAQTEIQRPFVDIGNLRACSEAYDISPDPKDYVFTEIPANNVDLPNRNLDAFFLEDCLEWRPELGRIAYQTYRFKACNANHDNKIPHRAKGVIFDSYMRKIHGHYYILVLAGWCRKKDHQLATRILEKRDAGYSMACLVGEARCSWCNAKSLGCNVTCKHVKGGKGKGTLWPTPEGPVLIFEKLGKLNFHEVSHVEDRADFDAVARWRA